MRHVLHLMQPAAAGGRSGPIACEPIITLKNEGELWIETSQGHRIRIHGADNPDRLRGAYLEALGLSRGAGSSGTSMSSRPRRLITFGITACP